MTKPSDFSPAEALEVSHTGDTRDSRRLRWTLRLTGVAILVAGWAAVSISDLGTPMLIVDTAIFLAMAVFAFAAATGSRRHAVKEERRLRLRLLVHNMELENLSMRDELTQLFNRRYLFERLERELHTAKGFQRPLAFIAVRVESLAQVNDAYGYDIGDRLLAVLGRRLLEITRATDIPARVNGGRFGIILPDTSKPGAYTMLERLASSIDNDPLLDDVDPEMPFVVSFGVSGHPWSGDTTDAIVQQAERECAAPGGAAQPPKEDVNDRQRRESQVPASFRRLDRASRGS